MHHKVAVLGAGVIGLTTASLFQETYPSAEVTIFADKFLTETTSDGAAGLFRPNSTFIGPTPEITEKWISDSFQFYNTFLFKFPLEAHEAGVGRISGYCFRNEKENKNSQNDPLKKVARDFRDCTAEELKMFGQEFKFGTFCTTVFVECRKYLPYLTKKFESRGGKLIKRKLESFEELSGHFDLVFNCTGLGSIDLCQDRAMTSIRGQVFKVKADWIKNFVYVDPNIYIIPTMSVVTLGGVKDFGSFNRDVDPYNSKAIWDGCVKVLPSLKNAKIEREWVGLRPHRAYVRVEKELLDFPDGKNLKVVHNYGHGGYGVTSAPGTSMHAIRLGSQFLKESQGLQSKI